MRLSILAILAGLLVVPAYSQTVLAVTGDVKTPLSLKAADLLAMPRESVTIPDQDGTQVKYEGVQLREILKRAGATDGRDLRGKALSTYILAKAHDGYEVVFTLGEVAAEFGNASVLVADLRDGKPLFGYQGPFRLVCPNDRAGARSVRMLLAAADEYHWALPKGFPRPQVPADNPMTVDRKPRVVKQIPAERHLRNGKQSCASCHRQELAFTDGLAVGQGATGEKHSRGPMSLVNVAYSAVLTWSNPEMKSLEQQALVPMFGEHPVELGLKETGGLPAAVREDSRYRTMFSTAFPGVADNMTVANAVKAIASFERSIISARSPYDRYHYLREDDAVSDAAKRGEILFFSQHISCFRCHGGFNFSGDEAVERETREVEFHNTGLYNVPGAFSYPQPNTGIFEFTKRPGDVGKFKAPTLRNIAVTAPYMHDGSIAKLEGVLDHYAAGGRTIALGPFAGAGHDNPNKDRLIGGFTLSPGDRSDFVEFLKSLTDTEVLHDPRFANPW